MREEGERRRERGRERGTVREEGERRRERGMEKGTVREEERGGGREGGRGEQ